jgi:hypothetical protein
MRNLLLTCFLIVFGHAYSQKSEQGFIKEIKYNYVQGEFNSAKEELEEALVKHPYSKQLLTLKSLVEEEGYAVIVPKNVPPSPKPPSGIPQVDPPKGGGDKTPPQPPRENVDPDNDGFIGSQDKCPSEFGEINGCPDSDGDKVPDNRDNCPDVPGSISNKGCKIIKQIQYNFKMTEQNLFSWNPEIGKSGAKTTITIDNYSGGKKTFDVTGLSKFNLVTKDSKFDGVECKIILTIQGDADLKIVGSNQLSETVTCSGNHRNK